MPRKKGLCFRANPRPGVARPYSTLGVVDWELGCTSTNRWLIDTRAVGITRLDRFTEKTLAGDCQLCGDIQLVSVRSQTEPRLTSGSSYLPCHRLGCNRRNYDCSYIFGSTAITCTRSVTHLLDTNDKEIFWRFCDFHVLVKFTFTLQQQNLPPFSILKTFSTFTEKSRLDQNADLCDNGRKTKIIRRRKIAVKDRVRT